jgi:hypothetical protein
MKIASWAMTHKGSAAFSGQESRVLDKRGFCHHLHVSQFKGQQI